MTTHERYGIPTVEAALQANGLYAQLNAYVERNSRNTIEIAACVNQMFDSQKYAAYNTLIGLWLIATVVTVGAGLIAQIIR